MSTTPRRIQGALALAVVGLAAGGGAGIFVIGKRTHVVTVDDAVARFRATAASAGAAPVGDVKAAAAPDAPQAAAAAAPSTAAARGVGGPAATQQTAKAATAKAVGTAPVGTAPGNPAAVTGVRTPRNGVYTYATTGHEEVSALGGSTHSYPATTTMSVAGTGCAQTARWDALKERYDQFGLCAVGQGIGASSVIAYHQFFGQEDKKTYACGPGTMLRPDSKQAGTTASGTCSGSGAKIVIGTRILGLETVRVGDVDVPAVKVHADEVLTGATEGRRTSDSWYALADNLLLKRTADTDADSDSAIGRTHYIEHFSIQLADLSPRT
jgi:hypothetical protein